MNTWNATPILFFALSGVLASECDEEFDAIEKIGDVKTYLRCIERRIPIGVIYPWDAVVRDTGGNPTGQTRTVPTGWQICNGTNGTPDLSERFLMGVTTLVQAGKFGGEATIAEADSHSHSGATASAAGPSHGIPCSGNCGGYRTAKHNHSFSTNESGAHAHGSNIPPHYKITYICKLETLSD